MSRVQGLLYAEAEKNHLTVASGRFAEELEPPPDIDSPFITDKSLDNSICTL